MSSTYRIKNKRSIWDCIFLPLNIFILCLISERDFKQYLIEPSLQTSWLLYTVAFIIVAGIIWDIRHFQTAYIVSIKDSSMSFQKTIGDKTWSPEVVITVTDYACSYQLNSKNKKIDLSKKLTPNDLKTHLHDKYLERWKPKKANKMLGSDSK